MELTFVVSGEPVPQGSARQVPIGNGPARRWMITSDNRNLGAWRQRVALEAQAARLKARFPFLDEPVAVLLEFRLTRPKSLPKATPRHRRRPDVDKLVRAVFDGLTGVVLADDACVDEVSAVKRYAAPGEPPGATVTVRTGTLY